MITFLNNTFNKISDFLFGGESLGMQNNNYGI